MNQKRLSTGIRGFDEVLHGGFIPSRAYLVRGGPGSGKTTLGLHFLSVGVANDEPSMYITFGEPAEQIQSNGAAIGFNTEAMHFLDLSPSAEFFTQIETYDIFSPAEVEREPTTQKLIESLNRIKPQRVFLDAITQFRYMSTDAFQFRKQVLSFMRYLLEGGATVIFTSEASRTAPDEDLQFMSDGVIHLHNSSKGRMLQITKFRGSDFRSGFHAVGLTDKGMQLFPRLQPENYKREYANGTVASGVPELDQLLHGGLERGTVTILTGPTGVGKTTIGLQFMKEAAGRGERSVVYTFEETEETLVARSESLNIPVQAMIKFGTLSVVRVDPL